MTHTCQFCFCKDPSDAHWSLGIWMNPSEAWHNCDLSVAFYNRPLPECSVSFLPQCSREARTTTWRAGPAGGTTPAGWSGEWCRQTGEYTHMQNSVLDIRSSLKMMVNRKYNHASMMDFKAGQKEAFWFPLCQICHYKYSCFCFSDDSGPCKSCDP